MTKSKVQVSGRALLQRINRALAKDDQIVKKTRPSKYFNELGDFYRLDTQVNGIIEKDVDLEALGRKLSVLADWEVLEES
jgi:hypothetical protein